MPLVEPNTTIRLGRVHFDSSYTHTPSWDNITEQYNWFTSQCDTALTKDDYTYVRMSDSIKIPFNVDEKKLYEYNYCMYQNTNYSSRWFYCFITDVEYVNDNTTELTLELDIMQTWYFDYDREAAFVERCHAKTDTVGEHTNPEPDMPFVQVYNTANMYTESFTDWWIVIQTTRLPEYAGASSTIPPSSPATRTFVKSIPSSGGKYTNIINGCKYYGFNYIASPTSSDYPFTMFLDDMNSIGSGDAITNIFQMPKALAPNRIDETSNWAFEEVSAPTLNRTIVQPSNFYYLDGSYTPRNNKLFTFPYCFARIDDNNGHSADWCYENWQSNAQGAKPFKITAGFDPDSTCFVIPQNYNGIANNISESFNFPCTTKCSWTTSPYLNWSAQNALGNAITAGVSIASLAIPAAKGVSAATKLMKAREAKWARGAAKNPKWYSSAKRLANYENVTYAKAQASFNSQFGNKALGGGVALGGLAGQYSKMSKTPEVEKGSTGGNSLLSVNALTYNIRNVIPKKEYAKIIDSFFDLYGYSMERIMTPTEYDIRSRKSWNFIKTQNCDNHVKANSGMPASDMEDINEIYNSGITFWKDHDHIGDYTQDNSIG